MMNIEEESVRREMAFNIEIYFGLQLPKEAWDHWPTPMIRKVHQKVIVQRRIDGDISEKDFVRLFEFGAEESYA